MNGLGRGIAHAVLGLVLLAAPALAQDQREMMQRADLSRSLGSPDAPIRVYEIADFECPFCARFSSEVFPLLDSAYVQTGKVQWVFVNLPLPSHLRAWAAAEAAFCAGAVADRFWPIHDRLFADQEEWSRAADPFAIFLAYAEAEDVPLNEFRTCLDTDPLAPLLIRDALFAANARVNGTPTFIVDQREVVVGYKSFSEWQALLEAALSRKASGR